MLNVSNNLSSCCPKPQIALAHNNNKFATKSIAFQAAAPSAAGSSFMNKAADFLKDIAKRAGDKIKEVAIKIWDFCVDKMKSLYEGIEKMFESKKAPAGTGSPTPTPTPTP